MAPDFKNYTRCWYEFSSAFFTIYPEQYQCGKLLALDDCEWEGTEYSRMLCSSFLHPNVPSRVLLLSGVAASFIASVFLDVPCQTLCKQFNRWVSLGGTLGISWQHIQCFLIMAATSSWFKRKQAWPPPQWLYTCKILCWGEGERCCPGPWWLQICWAGRACVVFLSFYSVWIWMTGGEAHSSVHCKSHYLLLQTPPLPATVYVTCRAPCPGRWNHRRKYMWRLNLLHVSRENTEENTILK